MRLTWSVTAVVWGLGAVAAARLARERGYPVVWIAVLMGPLGWLALRHLAPAPRPGPLSRHMLLQWAMLVCEGLPAGSLPGGTEPDLIRLAEVARERGLERPFAQGLHDMVAFERLWDRLLPWMVLNICLVGIAFGVLLVAAVAAFRSSNPGVGALLLMGLPLLGLLARVLLKGVEPAALRELLIRGQALYLEGLALLAGEPIPGEAAGRGRQVQQEVALRLGRIRRTGWLLGLLLASESALLVLAARGLS